eukprot:Hpha_TRINITY_DN13641_c0_g3::TRINITY_DN13641_c0_g3_i3::g.122836::m.122836
MGQGSSRGEVGNKADAGRAAEETLQHYNMADAGRVTEATQGPSRQRALFRLPVCVPVVPKGEVRFFGTGSSGGPAELLLVPNGDGVLMTLGGNSPARVAEGAGWDGGRVVSLLCTSGVAAEVTLQPESVAAALGALHALFPSAPSAPTPSLPPPRSTIAPALGLDPERVDAETAAALSSPGLAVFLGGMIREGGSDEVQEGRCVSRSPDRTPQPVCVPVVPKGEVRFFGTGSSGDPAELLLTPDRSGVRMTVEGGTNRVAEGAG